MTDRRRFTAASSALVTLPLWWPAATQAAGNLVRNPGFEDDGQPARDWTQDTGKTGRKGSIGRDTQRARSGQASLRLQPNAQNSAPDQLAVTQELALAPLRGKTFVLSAAMRTDGDARALVGLVVVGRRGTQLLQLNQVFGDADWTVESRSFDLPDDASARYFLALWVDGRNGNAWFDDISVDLPGAPSGAEPAATKPAAAAAATGAATSSEAGAQQDLQAQVEVDAGQRIRQIPRTLFGTNIEWRWNATSLWREDRDAVDADVVRMAREMGVTVVRYPGGIYSDFFDWRDSIGPRDRRPIRQHAPDKPDKTRPLFGTDEALAFARDIGGELLLTVNFANGTPQLAADWVRHVNARELRVRFWEVGNEIYINDGGAVSKAVTVEPEVYARRYLEFARAMRSADPRIRIGAVGGENYGKYRIVGYPDWNRKVLQAAGSEIDFLSIHNAYAPVIYDEDDRRRDLRSIYRAMLGAPVLIARNLETVSNQLAQWGSPSRKPFLAVTEWGPIFQWVHRGRYVDHNKTLGSALFCAGVLKALVESPRTEMANFFMLNDFGVTGWISSMNDRWPPPDPDWAYTARALAFMLFTRHFGDTVVRSQASGPTFDTEAMGLTDGVQKVPWLDSVASLSADGRRLYVIAINKHFDAPVDAAIALRGFRPAGRGEAWTLTGTGIDANLGSKVINVPALGWARQMEDPVHRRFHRGGPGEVSLSQSALSGIAERFNYRFPARSVTSLVLERA
jgi:alpha-N-arabinofuranosidase